MSDVTSEITDAIRQLSERIDKLLAVIERKKIAYNREKAAATTGITLRQIKEAISLRQLPAKKVGNSWIVLSDDLVDWLRSL
ncbi:MAG TPA: hypothetical protein VM260_26600 [Pirellula sp.]|nr:hypothetical protein [Pirellula sp.]